jgi:hypothetical protein
MRRLLCFLVGLFLPLWLPILLVVVGTVGGLTIAFSGWHAEGITGAGETVITETLKCFKTAFTDWYEEWNKIPKQYGPEGEHTRATRAHYERPTGFTGRDLV